MPHRGLRPLEQEREGRLSSLEAAARWLPVLSARSLAWLDASSRSTPPQGGRSAWVDEHHEELSRALEVFRVLQRMKGTEAGALHAATLELAFLRLGPALRLAESGAVLPSWYRLIGAWRRRCWDLGCRAPLSDSIDPAALLAWTRQQPPLTRGALFALGQRMLREAQAAFLSA